MSLLHIGFDDTDSRKGMCTTYLAYRIVEFLRQKHVQLIDYPLLARLNPNIPWKTRGNGAVALRLKVKDEDDIVEEVRNLVEINSHVGNGANPGLVFYSGQSIPDELKDFSSQAMHDIMSRRIATKLAERYNMRTFTWGNSQGIVGALSAVGMELVDHTFEIISYRKPENCGTTRSLSKKSVISMSEQTFPLTYNNYDHEHDRVLIAPRGPDPIFCGIRGEHPDTLMDAFSLLDIEEDLQGYMIFRTNHGTNMHLTREFDLANVRTYSAGFVRGTVASQPEAGEGGHTFFSIKNWSGCALCGVYEPTGMSPLAQKLCVRDLIEIGGGVRKATSKHPKVINVEYLRILKVSEQLLYENPLCSRCGKRLKSDGRNKGYKCGRCGIRDINATKTAKKVEREIREGLYLPLPKAQRHLTKPYHRYGIEKRFVEPTACLGSYWRSFAGKPAHVVLQQ